MNAFNRFQSLVGFNSIDVVTITANNGDGTSNATTLSGDPITIKGETITTGNNAFIRNGEIIRSAPNLTPTQVSI
jgi:hypothetical protein